MSEENVLPAECPHRTNDCPECGQRTFSWDGRCRSSI